MPFCPNCGRLHSGRMSAPSEPGRITHPGWPLVYEAQGFGWPVAEQSTLKERVSPQQLIKRLVDGRDSAFGPRSPVWVRRVVMPLLRQLQPGDEIWRYDSMTAPLSGAVGYYLIRDGLVQADIVLAVS